MAQEPGLLAVTNISWLSNIFSGWVANIVLAIIILLIGFILAKLAGRLVSKLLKEVELNAIAKKVANAKIPLESCVSSVIMYAIYLISTVAALNQLGLTKTVLYLSSIAVLFIVILSTFIGITGFVPNLVAGIFIVKKKLKVGDMLKTKQVSGKITRIGLTETTIQTKEGEIIYVPNSLVRLSQVS